MTLVPLNRNLCFVTTSAAIFLLSHWPDLAKASSDGLSVDNSVSLEFVDTLWTKNFNHLGQWNVNTVVSGFGLTQTNPFPTNNSNLADISNAMLIVEQGKGPVRFFAQFGYYDILDLGQPDQRASQQTINTFGLLPQAYISFVPSKNWSLSIGKLPALGGYESSFSYQNINIERGLLWSQTSSFSKGLQIDYADGPFSAAVAWTDGFYSNRLNWLGTQMFYQLSQTQKVGVVWTGAISPNSYTSPSTPLLQNNSQIMNLLYELTYRRWSFTPYLQYTYIPQNTSIGITQSSQTYGGALLMNYKFDVNEDASPTGYQKVSLPLRFEYLQSSGTPGSNAPNSSYGPGSSAWTATFTPTIQYQKYFARLEVSLIRIYQFSSGLGFGANQQNSSQYRGILELGMMY